MAADRVYRVPTDNELNAEMRAHCLADVVPAPVSVEVPSVEFADLIGTPNDGPGLAELYGWSIYRG